MIIITLFYTPNRFYLLLLGIRSTYLLSLAGRSQEKKETEEEKKYEKGFFVMFFPSFSGSRARRKPILSSEVNSHELRWLSDERGSHCQLQLSVYTHALRGFDKLVIIPRVI